MSLISRLSLLLMLAVTIAACGASRRGPATERVSTPLRVENHSWLQVNVYAVTTGQRIRLGSVPGNSTRVLQLPASVIGIGRDISFLVDPVGSSNVAQSFDLYVRPGEEVTLTVPPTVR